MPSKPSRTKEAAEKKAWSAFSEMIRIEASDEHGYCICVTCGRVCFWKGDGMQAGHFLGGRRHSILFDRRGVNPQCEGCNCTMHLNRNQAVMVKERVTIAYTMWMMEHHGRDVIEELIWKKDNESVVFTREDLDFIRWDAEAKVKKALSERMIAA